MTDVEKFYKRIEGLQPHDRLIPARVVKDNGYGVACATLYNGNSGLGLFTRVEFMHHKHFLRPVIVDGFDPLGGDYEPLTPPVKKPKKKQEAA